MCYSAKVWQRIKEYYRRTGATPDYAQFETIFERRRRNPGLRISRAFEANFDTPANAAEKRIRTLIDEHRATETTKLQKDLFAQRKRLADAERKLEVKETKKALEDKRIAGDKITAFTERLQDLDRPSTGTTARIFPFHYAPIVVDAGGERRLVLARYHCRQAGKPASDDRKYPGLYNARRDNLERYWAPSFGKNHAIAIFDAFFENVDRGGKNVVLQFEPRPVKEMLVACLYAHTGKPGFDDELWSFAAITDEPPPEVSAAGHDRCVVNLKDAHLDAWLTPASRSATELQQILGDVERPYYEHQELAA